MTDRELNKKSVINKINEMKNKKQKSNNNIVMNKLEDIVNRSKDRSKLSIKYTNPDSKNNLLIWLKSNSMKHFDLINSNENMLLENMELQVILEYIDNLFIDWVEECDIDITDTSISITFYEDYGDEEVEIYKKKIYVDNLNIIQFCIMSSIIENDEDDFKENEDGEKMIDLGLVKDQLQHQFIAVMVMLEKLKLKDSDLHTTCICENCENNTKIKEVKYTGKESKCIFTYGINKTGLLVKNIKS